MPNELIISKQDLKSLPEYSCSLPTGTTIGKKWRRNIHFHKRGHKYPEWQIGEYVPHPDPKLIGIKWAWAMKNEGENWRGEL